MASEKAIEAAAGAIWKTYQTSPLAPDFHKGFSFETISEQVEANKTAKLIHTTAIAEARSALDAAAAVDGDAEWNAAIEEAAKIADKVGEKDAFLKGLKAIDALTFSHIFAEAEQGREIAAAIRSLKRLK